MYRVFSVPPTSASRIDSVLGDDRVGRQSIAVRVADALGFQGKGILVIIEGEDSALARADTLFHGIGTALPRAEAEAVYRAVKSQEDSATSGMGLIFG